MIRITVVLLGLLIAAVPAQAQQPAAATPLPTPLPALLQPGAGAPGHAGLQGQPLSEPVRGAIFGMVLGCALFGGFAATEERAEGSSVVTDTVAGCGYGIIVGGAFGYAFAAIKQALR